MSDLTIRYYRQYGRWPNFDGVSKAELVAMYEPTQKVEPVVEKKINIFKLKSRVAKELNVPYNSLQGLKYDQVLAKLNRPPVDLTIVVSQGATPLSIIESIKQRKLSFSAGTKYKLGLSYLNKDKTFNFAYTKNTAAASIYQKIKDLVRSWEYLYEAGKSQHYNIFNLVSPLTIRFIPIRSSYNMPAVKEATSGNCFINALTKNRTIKPSQTKKLSKYNDIYVNLDDMNAILKILRLSARLYDVSNREWQVLNNQGKYPIVPIIIHNKHAELYDHKVPELTTYVNEESLNNILNSYIVYTKGSIVYTPASKFRLFDDCFLHQADYNANHESNPGTLHSRLLKQVVKTYSLLPDDDPFIAAGSHNFHPIKWISTEDRIYDGVDLNGCYPNYKRCSYYNDYKFPTSHSFIIKHNESININEQLPESSILHQTCHIAINNIEIHNSTYKSFCSLYPGVYPSVYLKFVYDNKLANFDIIAASISRKVEIDFHDLIDNQPYTSDKQQKKIINSAIGLLIPNITTEIEVKLRTTCEDERDYVLSTANITSSTEEYINGKLTYFITYTVPANKPKRYTHVHNFILSYARIRIEQQMLNWANKGITLAAWRTDAFYIKNIIHPEISFEEFGSLKAWKVAFISAMLQGFKYEGKEIKTGFNTVSSLDIYQTERSDQILSLINNYEYSNIDESLIPLLYRYRKIQIKGLAGCGKTYLFTNPSLTYKNTAIAFPNNNLLTRFTTTMPKFTYNKLYGISIDNTFSPHFNLSPSYKCIINDECTMMGMKKFRIITSNVPTDIPLIFICGINQLPPIKDLSIIDKYFDHTHNLTTIKRTEDPIYSRRQLDTLYMEECDIAEAFSDRNITLEEALTKFNICRDIIITSTHEKRAYFNNYFFDKAKTCRLPICVSYKSTIREDGKIVHAKDERTYVSRREYRINKKQYDLAWACTIHKIQGITLDTNVFFNSCDYTTNQHWIVATTRNTKLSNLHIINTWLDEEITDDTVEDEEVIEEDVEEITEEEDIDKESLLDDLLNNC